MHGLYLTGVAIVCALAPGFSGESPGVGPATTTPAGPDVEMGVASWYGPNFHGRAAASGEVYDMETLVAAHPTLPFNTWVRVQNLDNQKSVQVRIMDRGPFIEGRIIDLSHAAARAIGMLTPGTVPVRVEVIRIPEVDTADRFAVQVGAFVSREGAERIRAAMQDEFGVARIALRDGDPVMYHVWVGSEARAEDARVLAERIRQRTDAKGAFVVRPGE
jgi:rare lipoprotein A